MLRDLDLKKYTKVYIRTGKTDLRHGPEWLINLVQSEFRTDPYDKHALFLFCGCNARRIRGICWEGDGWILFTKVLYGDNRFQWPRTPKEAKMLLTQQEFKWLMSGMQITDLNHDIK